MKTGPFPFKQDGRKTALMYGSSFWNVVLPDGREASVFCDRPEVTATGALILWQETKKVPLAEQSPTSPATGKPKEQWEYEYERVPLEKPFPLAILAPGQWMSVYAASMIDGSVVCADHIDGFED